MTCRVNRPRGAFHTNVSVMIGRTIGRPRALAPGRRPTEPVDAHAAKAKRSDRGRVDSSVSGAAPRRAPSRILDERRAKLRDVGRRANGWSVLADGRAETRRLASGVPREKRGRPLDPDRATTLRLKTGGQYPRQVVSALQEKRRLHP